MTVRTFRQCIKNVFIRLLYQLAATWTHRLIAGDHFMTIWTLDHGLQNLTFIIYNMNVLIYANKSTIKRSY